MWIILINSLLWAFFVVSSAILFIGAGFLRLVTSPFDPNLKILQQYSCFWGSLFLWVNPFWSLTKHGLENVDRKKTYVLVSNHQSLADVLVILNTFLHFKCISKKSLFKSPLIGWNMWLNGYIPIDRGNPKSREELVGKCKAWLNKGSSILFFPEGTRSQDGQLLPFKIGAFRLAVETGFDILPIVIKGSLNAIPKHSIFLHGKSRMKLEVLPPVSLKELKGNTPEEKAEELSQLTCKRMQDKMISH